MIPMTNKQALEYIKIHRDVHKLHEPNAVLISPALDIACEALEQIDDYKRLLNLATETLDKVSDVLTENALTTTNKETFKCMSNKCNNECDFYIETLAGCCWKYRKEALNLLNNEE